RRRHTRSYGDWSSDVCSSDLSCSPPTSIVTSRNSSVLFVARASHIVGVACSVVVPVEVRLCSTADASRETHFATTTAPPARRGRSEERRVGKEWRERWAAYKE